VKGRWCYLYRASDSTGATIDFLLSALRDAAAAKRLFRKRSEGADAFEEISLGPCEGEVGENVDWGGAGPEGNPSSGLP